MCMCYIFLLMRNDVSIVNKMLIGFSEVVEKARWIEF